MVPRESRKTIFRRNPKSNLPILLYGILFSVLLFLLNLVKPTFTDFLDNRIYDTLLSASKGEPSPVPVIVDIDEESLKQ